jgi:hypothetical protein
MYLNSIGRCGVERNQNEPTETKTEKTEDIHYKECYIEPIEYIMKNNLPFCEGNIVKYITRWRTKGGVDDLRKIKTYIDYLIKEEIENNG